MPTPKDLSSMVEENDEYRSLLELHQGYEQRLEELTRKPYLSAEEEYEEHELKKKKLRIKDRIEVLRRGVRAGAAAS